MSGKPFHRPLKPNQDHPAPTDAEACVRCLFSCLGYVPQSVASSCYGCSVAQIVVATGLDRRSALLAAFTLTDGDEPRLVQIGDGDGCDIHFALLPNSVLAAAESFTLDGVRQA